MIAKIKRKDDNKMKNKRKAILVGAGFVIGILLAVLFFNSLARTSELESSGIEGTSKPIQISDVGIDYKDSNITVEFKKDLSKVGKTKLKSHKTYDEVLRVPTGNRVLVWYEFSDFKESYKDAIGKVKFLDMRETIINQTYIEEVGGLKFAQDKLIIIPNPNYLQEVQKDYEFVYLSDGEWLPYTSKDIPNKNIIIGIQADIGWGEILDVIPSFFENDLDRHAIVLGTNAGFVSARPSGDPGGTDSDASDGMRGTRHITAVGTSAITEIGFWADGFGTGFNAQTVGVAIYNNDGSDLPTNLVGSSSCAVSGTNDEWKYCSVSIAVNESTEYWIAVSFENTASATNYGGAVEANTGAYQYGLGGTIPDPFVEGGTYTFPWAMYAVEGVLGGLDIDSLYPLNNTNISTSPIVFSANVSDDNLVGVKNVTLSIWNTGTHVLQYNVTNASTIVGIYNFSVGLDDGSYNWTVYANDDSDVKYESISRIFTLDATPPSIVITYPNKTIVFHERNQNLTLNWSILDDNIASCWYNWMGTDVSVNCSTNTTGINITDGTDTDLTFYVNDTFGHESSNTTTWDYGLFLNSETYTQNVYEGLSSTFSANFYTNGTTMTSAILNYNNTEYTGTISDHSGYNYTVSRSVTAPVVDALTNVSFFWNVSYGILEYNLTAKNQTILNIKVDNCTENSVVIYNFELFDEEHQTKILFDNTSKVDLSISSFPSKTLLAQYNNSFKANPFSVCLNSTLGTSQFIVDAQIQYTADGYATELYHIQNETISNSSLPMNISLYPLNSSDVQAFKIIFRDSSFLPVEDALVKIYRKYIDEGVFKIIELPKTDARGETVASLVLNDVIYNFVIVKYGVTLATFSNVIAVCQTPLVASCEIDLNAFSDSITIPDYEEDEDFLFTLDYNKTSQTVSSQFSIPSGDISTIELVVTRQDALGTSICTDSLVSSSGTLSCVVPSSFGNSTIMATLNKNGSLKAKGSLKAGLKPSDWYGLSVVFLALFIMLTLLGAGLSDNPIFTVLFFMVGIILLFALNLVSSTGFIGAGATILWIIIAIVIIIIKGGRRN